MKFRMNGMFFSLLLPLLLLVSFTKSSVSEKETTNTEPTEVKNQDNPPTYYTMDKLPMNRDAINIKWRPIVKLKYTPAHTGFLFDIEDNTTQKWRPQGIAGPGVKIGGKSFIVTSWYGRPKTVLNADDYKDRGARISIVNVTNMDKISYRHVLLVDQNGNTFEGCHAGGIAIVDDKLHVADGRGSQANPLSDGSYDKVLVFDLTKIEKIETAIKKYHYVLRLESTYNLPLSPGYLSYDRDSKKMIAGTFTCATQDCDGFTKAAAKLCIYDPATVNRNTSCFTLENLETKYNSEFREIQGASTLTYEGKEYLFTARSFGLKLSSINIFEKVNGEWDWVSTRTITVAGLEDIYFSSENLWTLSEFSPIELGDRGVVAMKISTLINDARKEQAARINSGN